MCLARDHPVVDTQGAHAIVSEYFAGVAACADRTRDMRRASSASRTAKLRFHVLCVLLSGCFLGVDVVIHLSKTLFAALSTWTSVLNVLYFGFSVYADVTSKNTRAWLPPRDRCVRSGYVWPHITARACSDICVCRGVDRCPALSAVF